MTRALPNGDGEWPAVFVTVATGNPLKEKFPQPAVLGREEDRGVCAAPSDAEDCCEDAPLLLRRTPPPPRRRRPSDGPGLAFCDALADAFGVDASHELRWRHAVNSRRRLRWALADDSVQMLEADVCIGDLIVAAGNLQSVPLASQSESDEDAPSSFRNIEASGVERTCNQLIMAHYPTSLSSDLSFEEFVVEVMQHNAAGVGTPKGLKLDFKKMDCVGLGMAKLVELHNQISAVHDLELAIGEGSCRSSVSTTGLLPVVFVNADVVRGPCFVPTLIGRWLDPLPAEPFVKAVTAALAKAPKPTDLNVALSLGWTVGLPIMSGRVLTDFMADAMLSVIPLARSAIEAGLLRHITLAVSAACAHESKQVLERVLAGAGTEASLTFFTPTFGRGVTRSEAEALVAYPLCPPYGLFLDMRERAALPSARAAAARCKAGPCASALPACRCVRGRSCVMAAARSLTRCLPSVMGSGASHYSSLAQAETDEDIFATDPEDWVLDPPERRPVELAATASSVA